MILQAWLSCPKMRTIPCCLGANTSTYRPSCLSFLPLKWRQEEALVRGVSMKTASAGLAQANCWLSISILSPGRGRVAFEVSRVTYTSLGDAHACLGHAHQLRPSRDRLDTAFHGLGAGGGIKSFHKYIASLLCRGLGPRGGGPGQDQATCRE